MKNLNLIERLLSDSHEKQKPQRFARYAAMLIMLLTLGVGQMWADDKGFYEVYMVYDKNGTEYNYTYNGSNGSMDLGTITSSFKIKKMYLKVWDNWGDQAFEAGSSGLGYKTQSGSDTDFKANTRSSESAHDYELQHTNMNLTIASNTNPSGNYTFTHWWFADGPYTSTYYLKNGSSNCAFTYKILPPAVKSGTVAVNATNTAPGSGTGLSSGSPIILVSGMASTLTITATQNHTDANSALWCKFGGNSYSSTTTYNIASGTTTSNQTIALKVKYRNNSASLDGAETTTTIYYKWAAPAPAIVLTSVTPSTSIVAGNDITLVGTRANSSNTISFQYTTNDGSTWTDITPKTTSGTSTKTITWTVPDAHGATQTFKFRACLAADSKESAKSSGVTVYNTKTIHVKNSNNWGTLYLYAWDGSGDINGSWPGTTGSGSNGWSCTQVGSGLWWDMVITSQATGFIIARSSEGDANKTVDLYYSSYTNDACYAMGTGSGKKALSNTTVSCLSAPSCTTADVTPTVNNSATLGGTITGLGNDKVSYGYYYSTNSALSSSNTGVGTKVTIGTKMALESYSQSQTGLTGGTTYYVMAFVTNGHSTAYGTVKSFTTPKKVTPSLSTGGSSISPNTVQYTTSYVDFTAVAATGYTFSAWSKTNGNLSNQASPSTGTNTVRFTPTADNATITATYTENSYNTNVAVSPAGKGSISSPTPSEGKISVKQVTGTSVTASANANYVFTSWSVSGGGLTVSSTTTNPATFKATAASGTITANFADQWNVKGSWDSWAAYEPMTATGVSNTYRATKTLAAKTEYHIKVVKRVDNNSSNDKWYGVNGGTTLSRATGSVTGLEENGGVTEYITFTTDVAGDYTITYLYNASVGSMKVTVGYPTAYTITYGVGTINGSSTAISVSPSFTSGDYVLPETDVTFSKGSTKAGYTWKGWYSNEGGTGDAWSTTDASLSLTATRTGNISVYACYNYATYTATMTTSDRTGYGSGAPANQTATYTQAMPTITPPTAANGYCFMGYWDDEEGAGTQYYNANGTSAHVWDKTSGATLYAYFKKAEITTITLNATMFEPVGAGDVGYVVANPTIAPTPTGTTAICWELLYDNDNPVTGHEAEAYTEGGTKPDQVHFSIAGLAAGSYKIRATLHTGDGACGSGTTLSVQEASFTIASNFTVTILYKCGDVTIKSSTTNPGKALEGTSITAPDIIGYTFSKWKAGDGVTIDGADASGEKATATITYTANYNGSLTAIYTKKRMIYFYNTLSWSNVYVYFYKDGNYWDNAKGTGTDPSYYSGSHAAAHKGQMLPIEEGSKIYYFDAEAASIPSGYTNVAFTEKQQDNCWYFYENNKVIRRGDYKATTLPMFVPMATQTPVDKNSNTAKYYNEGYWMNYPENTGYTLRIYDTWGADNATGASREYLIPYSSDKKMPLTQDVEINFSGKTWFLIYRNDGNYLAGSHTFKQTEHNDYAMSSTDNAGTASKMTLLSDGEGIYTFNLSYHGDGANPENFHYYINVDFPAALGDYRIVYKDNAEWSQGSAHTSSWYHPSKVIPKIKGDATEAKKDTVSFFVAKGDGITTSMKFQYISAINGTTGAVTWADVASGSITIPSSITTSGVYNFIVTQPVGGGSISVESAEPYTGNYYIRTDNAGDTKWNNYRSRDHQMVYTEFSRNRATNTFGELYTHYFTSWCERKTNIKFCIANDYSPCISDTLGQDVGNPYSNTDTGGNLNTDGATLPINDKYSANVRFMYNETTNKICRAYVGSSTNPARKFLMLEGNVELHGDDNEPISDWSPRYALILADKQNWIYEHVLKIKPKTRFKLYACYAQTTVSPDGAQYFRGAYDSNQFTSDDNSVILIDGAGDADYQMARIIYDFKTNRLMTAWIPSGSDVSGDMQINADVLVEREHHEPAQYITFANASSQLSGVKTVYGAMKFNRWILNNRQHSEDQRTDHAGTAEQIATYHAPLPVGQQKSIYERSLYFISFPFDVNASEIFGFGHYWDEWYLEYYDGLNRAKNGYWEDSPPNWKYVTPSMLNDFVLKANEGYILGLDLDYMQADNFDFWSNGISTVELFFPSKTTQGTLQQTNCTIPALSAIEGDPYRCTINRGTTEGDRRVKDSYWRCMGVPSFNIYNTSLLDGSGNPITWKPDGNTLPFIYAWNKADNTLTAQSTSTFTFLPMHAYLVQNGGEIRWTNVSAKPASPIVARRVNEQPATEYEWRLALTSDSVLIDQTYVKMSNIEQVTDTFDFNQDMIKEFNPYRSDIYTYIGYERVAANSMPLQTEQTTVIPVGVKIKDAGDYTFAMPDGTNGVGVTLVDTQTGVRTNLGLMDYTVTLTAGSFNQRFVLEISPIMQTPTDIEEVTGDGLQVTGVRKVLIDQKMYIIRDGKVYDARGAKVK